MLCLPELLVCFVAAVGGGSDVLLVCFVCVCVGDGVSFVLVVCLFLCIAVSFVKMLSGLLELFNALIFLFIDNQADSVILFIFSVFCHFVTFSVLNSNTVPIRFASVVN